MLPHEHINRETSWLLTISHNMSLVLTLFVPFRDLPRWLALLGLKMKIRSDEPEPPIRVTESFLLIVIIILFVLWYEYRRCRANAMKRLMENFEEKSSRQERNTNIMTKEVVRRIDAVGKERRKAERKFKRSFMTLVEGEKSDDEASCMKHSPHGIKKTTTWKETSTSSIRSTLRKCVSSRCSSCLGNLEDDQSHDDVRKAEQLPLRLKRKTSSRNSSRCSLCADLSARRAAVQRTPRLSKLEDEMRSSKVKETHQSTSRSNRRESSRTSSHSSLREEIAAQRTYRQNAPIEISSQDSTFQCPSLQLDTSQCSSQLSSSQTLCCQHSSCLGSSMQGTSSLPSTPRRSSSTCLCSSCQLCQQTALSERSTRRPAAQRSLSDRSSSAVCSCESCTKQRRQTASQRSCPRHSAARHASGPRMSAFFFRSHRGNSPFNRSTSVFGQSKRNSTNH